MRNYIYITLLLFIVACGKDDCQNTYYLSNNDKAFIPYKEDSKINIIYSSSSGIDFNWEDEFYVTEIRMDTIKEHDALGINPCANYFETKEVELFSESNINNIEVNKGYDNIWLEVTREDDEFNVSIYLNKQYLHPDSIAINFYYHPFENSHLIKFQNNVVIDSKEYNNVYLMVEPETLKDSLYYSPNYGLIKLISETGTYTFENLE